MGSIGRKPNHRRKKKRGAYTNQHEASLRTDAAAGCLYSQPPKRARPPSEKILGLCTRVAAGVDTRGGGTG